MVIAYLDTSAAMKLLIDEAESDALAAYVQQTIGGGGGELAAAWLLHTELHCAAQRHPAAIDGESVGMLLDAVTLVDITRGDLLTAGSLPAGLRSHDAIHLAVALRIGADAVISYDVELQHAVAAAGLTAVSPR